MSDTLGPVGRRPARFQGASLLGGLLIGALVMGAVAPLVGTERTTTASSAGGVPDFLVPGGTGGDAAPGLTGPDGAGAGEAGIAGAAPGDPGFGTDTGSASGGVPDSGPAAAGGTGPEGQPGAAGPGAPAGQPGAAGGPAGPAAGPRTASDVGVTASTIRLGLINLKCEACRAFGVTTGEAASQATIGQAFAADLNARGGVNGRKVELFTANYDPAQDQANGGGTERAACLELTENRKVFAVLRGGANTNACIYDEHETPLIAQLDFNATDPDAFNKSGGRIWSLDASAGRVALDWARQIDQQRLFSKSTKFGVVYEERTAAVLDRYFFPELKRLGYQPTKLSKLPNDPSAATVKIAQEVPAMRATGVTHLVMSLNFVFAANWVREAQRNGWKPQYLVSDFGVGGFNFAGDQVAQGGNDWSGAIALSSATDAPFDERLKDPVLRPCLDTYERFAKRKTEEKALAAIAEICTSFRLFERAAKAAGTDLTRQGFIQQLARTGSFTIPTRVGGAASFGSRYSLGTVKWSGTDQGQRKVWTNPCPYKTTSKQCYVTVGRPYRLAG